MIQIKHRSPNKLNATKKPIINKVNRVPFQRNNRQTYYNKYQSVKKQKSPTNKLLYKDGSYCSNHSEKLAQFYASYDDQDLNYCQKCAINLASKGFQVHKISQRQNMKKRQRKINCEFNYPEFESTPGYAQVKQLVDNIDILSNNSDGKLIKYTDIKQHYQFQYQITDNYYQSLLNTIEQMRQDHLNDLLQQQRKHQQIAQINIQSLSQDMKTLDTIRNDLISNLQIILNNLHEQDIKKNLSYYRQEILINYKSKIEDHQQFFKEVINYTQNNLKSMLKRVQNFLLQIWDQYQVKPKTQQKIQKPMPKVQNNNHEFLRHLIPENPQRQKTACRKLFEDSIQLAGETSPQFKNI